MQNSPAQKLEHEATSAALQKQKKPYQKPELTVHGKVEKLTLQTGDPIPGGGLGGLNVIP